MRKTPAVIIGGCIVMAAIIHAWLCSRPILTGHLVAGFVTADGRVWNASEGCKVEFYESFVIVHLEKNRNWTQDLTVVIPREKITNMELKP